jgi:hypothetical protein
MTTVSSSTLFLVSLFASSSPSILLCALVLCIKGKDCLSFMYLITSCSNSLSRW